MPEIAAGPRQPDVDHAQLYDLLIAQLTDFAVFLIDQEGVVQSWNPGVERLLGYRESEWVGTSVSVIFTPEDRSSGAPQEEIASAFKSGQSPDLRWHLRKDGSRLFVDGTLVALRNPAGELLGFSKVMRDVTIHKERELQLENSLAFAESIVDTVREPMLVLDAELRIRSANRSFYDTFQVPKTETKNQRLFELGKEQWNIPRLHILLQDLASGQTTIENFEVEHDFPGLGPKVMLLNARRIWRDGTHTELTLLALEDITERRQAEKALADNDKQRRLIINAAPAIISYVDRDLRYRLANDTYERWFGIPARNLIGTTIATHFSGPVLARLQPHLEEVLAGRPASYEGDFPTPSGGTRTIQVSYTPDVEENGHVQGFVVLGTDMTERKQNEVALRKSEERWRSLFERMNEGFFLAEMLYDAAGKPIDFRFLEVNRAFETQTGFVSAAGRTVREVLPGIQQSLIDTYAEVVATGLPKHFEVLVPALGNRWFEARSQRSERNCFSVIFVDISARKDAEVELRASAQKQTALVTLGDQLRDLKDLASLTSAAMEIVGKTMGLARAGYGEVDPTHEFLQVGDGWTNGTVPSLAGNYRFRDFSPDLSERLQRGELIIISDVETHPITAAESARWEALNIRAVINVPLLENGSLVAVLFLQDSCPRKWSEADITFVRKVADRTWAAVERARALQELQESEEFTRSILASSPDCVKVVDLEGRVLTINEGGCQQMEIDDFSVCLNQPWINFWGIDKEAAEQALLRATQGLTSKFEGFCATYKGQPKWWEVVVTPMSDAAGRPARILSLARDITDRRRAEQERERLTNELKRSNEDLSQFAHIVAHDLQAPLRGVTSFAQLLQRNAKARLTEGDRDFLHHIVESARRMQDLVQALLRFAQLGQGEIERKPVAMENVLHATLHSLQMQIDEQHAVIHKGPMPTVTGDSVQLVQLLQNLVGNALKYHRAGKPPAIDITAAKNSNEFVFSIQDNGEGIPAEQQMRIFEPLTRLHGADVPGTGLGLAMCQRIVNRHGGRIWVESTTDLGSTFFFTLPRT